MVNAFRFSSPLPRSEWIGRPRLIVQLERRFELDAIVMAAPAGYGKTTVLAQLLAEPADVARIDLWLQCEPRDVDADTFGRALLQASGLDVDGTSGAEALGPAVVDALLRFAPRHVCLVLDDIHVLTPGSDGLALLAFVLGHLPRNAHLLLCGRANPGLPLGRLLSHGRAELCSASDLAYDDDELDRVAVSGVTTPARGDRAADPSDALDPLRWPASARLSHGGDETVSELLVEIANGLDVEERAALTALSSLPSVNDEIVAAATQGTRSANELLGSLPLVQRSGGAWFQMHDLWRRALCEDSDVDERSLAAMARVADQLLALGHFVQSATISSTAGSAEGVERAAHRLLEQPLMHTSTADLRSMAGLARRFLGDHPVTDLLAASIAEATDERDSASRFEAVAARAEQAGDVRIEVLAIQNAMNMRSIVDPASIGDRLLVRAEVLATAGSEMARSCAVVMRAHRARLDGEPERSAAILGELSGVLAPMFTGSLAFGLSDLGRPEEIPTPGDLDEAAAAAAQAGGQALAQALWLRGDVSADLALELGTQLADATDDGQVPNQAVSTNAVLALVACAAGDDRAAQQFVDRANRWSPRTAGTHVRGLAVVAEAALGVCAGDSDGAREQLGMLLAVLPVVRWPSRPYLYSLPMVYTLAPEVRPVIDSCRFGGAYTAVVRAAQALVALIEHGDATRAAALDWTRVDLLRAHVLPPHLAVLASAAAASGDADVGVIVDQIPSLRRHLGLAAGLDHVPTARWARAYMTGLPARPPYDLRVELLGPSVLWRGATKVSDPEWIKRDRVRQLFALVMVHRRLPRIRAAELLWPELPIERAMSNLRVNLSHLQRVLQPTRAVDERPWFLLVDNDMLAVASTGVEVDVHEFERLGAAARAFDDAGRITAAIDEYRRAADRYRGDFVEEWPNCEWAANEQRRLRALVLRVLTRLAELLLARGEPEASCDAASQALRFEPLHEPAARCFVKSLAGQGDRVGAVRAMHELLDRLDAEGLRPDWDTLRLASTFDVHEPRVVIDDAG